MQIQRAFNAFADGFSTHLVIEGITPPNVQDAVEEIKAGGLLMAVDIPLGFQKMEAMIKVNARQQELMTKAGLAPGARRPYTFRSVAKSEIDGGQQDEVIILDGRLNTNYAGWQAQSVPKDEYKISTIFNYKHTINGRTIHHIDLLNYIGIVDGVDHFADIRNGLGL